MSQESREPRNDAELASAFAGEEPALRRLLWGLLREAAAVDDVLQITFLKLLQNPPQTRSIGNAGSQQESGPPAAGAGGTNSLRAWLFRVATNEALLVKRKQNTQAKHLEGLAWLRGMSSTLPTAGANSAIDPQQAAIATEQQLLIKKLLARLSEEQQTIVRMRIYENLKFVEIAERLNLPLGTVLTRMRAALHTLKTGLENFE